MRLKKNCGSANGAERGRIIIRAAGQRSLHQSKSTTPLLPRRPNSTTTTTTTTTTTSSSSTKSPNPISLSDYLTRKLQHSTQEKQKKTLLPTGHGDGCFFLGHRNHLLSQQTGLTKENGSIIDNSVFKQFRRTPTTMEGKETRGGLYDQISTQSSTGAKEQESRKRKNTFPGRSVDHHNLQPGAQKHLLIIGDDPKPRHGTHDESSFSNKKARPLFNHYENGKGWWDYEREGVDNDEVGSSEAWEGMASTTLGELHWH